jgi:murein DD-endopeptidase MepM/ murein hydrolase activator NlpD
VARPIPRDDILLEPTASDPLAFASRGIRRYTVRGGDTVALIAKRFGVSTTTVRSANQLRSDEDVQMGRVLTIPTVDGLLVTVRPGDTVASLAAAFRVQPDAIREVNGLAGGTPSSGSVIVIPLALEASPSPKPKPSSTPRAAPATDSGAPAASDGRGFVWPVVGGNYVSQEFHSGHGGVDIAAAHGSRVRAAGAGTVTFAGWKSNGGGYQVWISHGKGMYTTYNHMSAVSVGRGQKVTQGQGIGRVGSTGRSTGPHLHFEVWRGAVWDGGKRVNPRIYL